MNMPIKAELFKEGYIIVPSAVPADMCQAVVADIDEYVAGGGDRYLGYGGMVELYHRQSMWNVRQHPAVYAAFAELFGTEELWVSIDRCNYKEPFPKRPEGNGEIARGFQRLWDQEFNKQGFIHWDVNVNQRPRPFGVQGVIALTDTALDMGGFQCVPMLYQNLDEHLEGQSNRKIRNSNLDVEVWSGAIVRVAMKAGDLLIWDSFLPHGNGVNRSDKPRYAMYVTMFPKGDERAGSERMNCWLHGLPPSGWAFPGDPREIERIRDPEHQRPPRLTKLGMRLLG